MRRGVFNLVMLIVLITSSFSAHSISMLSSKYRYTPWALEDSKKPIVENVVIYPKEHENSEKKIARRGRLIRYEGAQGTVLISHGFMCDKFDVGFLRGVFPSGRFNFMTFDFRAHGEDKAGQLCTFGRDEAYDVIAAAEFLKNHPKLKGKPLIAYGFSMGAVASIEAQAKKPLFSAMILDCPFDSSENVLRKCLQNIKISLFGYEFTIPGCKLLEKYAFHPYVQSFVKLLLKTVAVLDPRKVETQICPFKPAESIKKVSVPCLFIHCKNDEKVPIDAIKTVFEGAAGPKRLWLTNGRRHFDSYFYNPEKYIQRVQSFLHEALGKKLGSRQENQILVDVDEEGELLVG